MRWRALTAVWMLGILVVSLLPPELGGRGGWNWHLLGYGVLVLLLSAWQPAGVAAAVAWGYGAMIEGLQWLVRYRDADAGDLMVNAAGVIVGVVVWAVWRRGGRR